MASYKVMYVLFIYSYTFISFILAICDISLQHGYFVSLVFYNFMQVKSLLTVRAEAETPVSAVSIRRIPRLVSTCCYIIPVCKAFHRLAKQFGHIVNEVFRRGDSIHLHMSCEYSEI